MPFTLGAMILSDNVRISPLYAVYSVCCQLGKSKASQLCIGRDKIVLIQYVHIYVDVLHVPFLNFSSYFHSVYGLLSRSGN